MAETAAKARLEIAIKEVWNSIARLQCALHITRLNRTAPPSPLPKIDIRMAHDDCHSEPLPCPIQHSTRAPAMGTL